MAGYAPQLPLNPHDKDGYSLLMTLEAVVKQNLKTLLMTVPGEKMWDADFGLDLKRHLFEFDSPVLRKDIKAHIRTQIEKYLPVVEILEITIYDPTKPVGAQADASAESLNVRIDYEIIPLAYVDTLIIGESAVSDFTKQNWW